MDANPILSAIIGGKALKIFLQRKIEFYTTDFTMTEVQRYIPYFSKRKNIPEVLLQLTLMTLPVNVFDKDVYRDTLSKANEIMGKRDPNDVHLLALALKFGIPLWSNDKDFERAEIEIFTTEGLLKLMG